MITATKSCLGRASLILSLGPQYKDENGRSLDLVAPVSV